jgi:peptidase M23-like protein
VKRIAIAAGAVAAAVVALFAVAVLLLMTMVGGSTEATSTPVAPVACLDPVPGSTPGSTTLKPRQAANAAMIIAVGRQLGIPPRGWVVAIATARQEADLLNLASRANPGSLSYPHDDVAAGDHDSVGIMQQRDAWGSMAERMNVAAAARMFYTGGHAGQRGLTDIKGWEQMSIAEAAQAVQVSAFPDAYAQWEALAVRAVHDLADADIETGCDQVAAGPWTNPLGKASYRKTAGFGACSHLWGNCHTGQDMALPSGAEVYAASAGQVIRSSWGGAYGNLVKIQHADGVQTWYAHLTDSTVQPGTAVEPGTLIGHSGSTGNTTGPHLHFEVRVRDEPINPVPFMAAKGVSL